MYRRQNLSYSPAGRASSKRHSNSRPESIRVDRRWRMEGRATRVPRRIFLGGIITTAKMDQAIFKRIMTDGATTTLTSTIPRILICGTGGIIVYPAHPTTMDPPQNFIPALNQATGVIITMTRLLIFSRVSVVVIADQILCLIYRSYRPTSHWDSQNRHQRNPSLPYRPSDYPRRRTRRPTPGPPDSNSWGYRRSYHWTPAPPNSHKSDNRPTPDPSFLSDDVEEGNRRRRSYYKFSSPENSTPSSYYSPSILRSCSPDPRDSSLHCYGSSPKGHLSSPEYSPRAPRSYTPSLDAHSSPSSPPGSRSRSEDDDLPPTSLDLFYD